MILATTLVILLKKIETILDYFSRYGLVVLVAIIITLAAHTYFGTASLRKKRLRQSLKIAIAPLVIACLLLLFNIYPAIYQNLQSHLSVIQDLQIYVFGILFMAGIAYTLKHNEHVRIDIFYQRYSAKTKAIINIIGTALFLFPICFLILYASLDLVINSWPTEKYRIEGGLPFLYVLKSFIVIMPVLVLIQGIAELIKHTITILSDHHYPIPNTRDS